jgi:hypothetical protein
MTRGIYREGGVGLNGLNKGLTSTLGRNGIWNMIYFGNLIILDLYYLDLSANYLNIK